MMSLDTIQEMSRKAARKASREKKVPTVVEQDDITGYKRLLAEGRTPRFAFPQLGDFCPKGYVPTGVDLFVDSSGFGGPGEPALTVEAFVNALKPGLAYGVTDVGQFQLWCREFRRVVDKG